MIRDISPASYNAPGASSLSLSLIIAAASRDPLPLDVWLSNYSPSADYLTNLASGFNAISVIDTTNCRFFIVIPPRGNAVSITLKGVTGDTGLAVHPNGPIILTLPSASPPATIGLTTGGTITGVRIIQI